MKQKQDFIYKQRLASQRSPKMKKLKIIFGHAVVSALLSRQSFLAGVFAFSFSKSYLGQFEKRSLHARLSTKRPLFNVYQHTADQHSYLQSSAHRIDKHLDTEFLPSNTSNCSSIANVSTNLAKSVTNRTPEIIDAIPRRPLVRLIDNIWYVMCTPFPDLRKLNRKRENDSKHVVKVRLRDGFAAIIAYFAFGVISYRYIFEKWSFVDALYFSCVTITTVGYGDIVPVTVAGRFFAAMFGMSGIALLGAAVARIGSRLVEAEIEAIQETRKQSQRTLLQVYDKMPKVVKMMRKSSQKSQNKVKQEARELLASIPHPQFPPFLTTFWKATRYILQSLSVIIFGGLLIGAIEGWKWYDSVYFALITASTIGLGDIAPITNAGKLACVIFIPMAVAAAGEILASIGLALVEQRQKNLFRTQLQKGLTIQTLENMDINQDGKVERDEYVSYMLMEMGLVTKDELEELWDQFRRLDATKSGYLDHDDLMLMAKLRNAGLVES